MANDTIKDFTAAELTAATTALGAAEADLTDAAKKAGDAATEVDTVAKQITGETSTGAAIRLKLATAPTAPEVAALADELLQHEIRLHVLQAKAAAAQYQATLARARVSRASAAVARAKQAATDAQRASDEAAAQDTDWQKNVTAAVVLLRNRNPAFSAAAIAAKASGAYVDAQQRVEQDVPQPLRDDARVRATALRDGVTQAAAAETIAETSAADAYKAHEGESGAVVAARLDFERKRARLLGLADAERQLDEISVTLRGIATAPALSSAARNRRDSAKLSTAAALAAFNKANQDVKDQEKKIADKQTEIDAAAPANKPPLELEKAALVTALTPLADALAAATTARDAASDVYEDSIPEETWRRLSAFDDAIWRLDTLIALTNATIDTVRTDYANAEKALAAALKKEVDGRRAIADAEAKLAIARDTAASERERGQTQLLAALRGDV